MRDPARIDVMLGKLGELWKRWPDFRLGQLVENIACKSREATGSRADTFHVEDDRMLAALEAWVAEDCEPEPSQPATKFKVGDLVRVIDPEASMLGKVGRVYNFLRNRPCVRFENGNSYGYNDEDIEFVGRCECFACMPPAPFDTMRLCPKCGNKRCPKVENHRYRCTRSNEPGQVGVLEQPVGATATTPTPPQHPGDDEGRREK